MMLAMCVCVSILMDKLICVVIYAFVRIVKTLSLFLKKYKCSAQYTVIGYNNCNLNI